ncbi:aluminum-activated malate transporter 2-like [Mangifera indica]|uniref:aluminum-activated malate transporter 2-like n=1 Tax=Mangifera indica TaxID=29780 RepID=UPI001CFA18C1|nr:aluminum-activated malate transporter 2-like [Mangifera indica]XP_044506756.1 aluminum-activated malate transporter 2-like [Mangifera indica]
MEMEPTSLEKAGFCAGAWLLLKGLPEKLKHKVAELASKAIKLGKDDPRRVVHSLKVGLALNVVSLLYYLRPLYNDFGVSATWAIMTVVFVFEYSVGATLGKGLNRGFATFIGGALSVGAHQIACLSGEKAEPIMLGLFVFLQAAASTFLRFFPKIKARYDYALLIFILTFSMISVSGFRDDEIIDLARRRLLTILIGGFVCVIICILICPVWAGQDLHNLIATNIDKLGNFLEGFGNEYFNKEGETEDDKSFLQQYKSVLTSKSTEESLTNSAKWEPGHGQFQFRHPWNLYLKIGTLTRQCAYRIDALNGYLNAEIQTSSEMRYKIEEVYREMSLESGKALKELALAIKTMSQPSAATKTHIENSKSAAKSLNSLFKSNIWGDTDLQAAVPVAAVASLLIDVVACTEKIAQSVYELASMANFKSIEVTLSPEKSQIRQQDNAKSLAKVDDCPYVCVTVNEPTPAISGNGYPSLTMPTRISES